MINCGFEGPSQRAPSFPLRFSPIDETNAMPTAFGDFDCHLYGIETGGFLHGQLTRAKGLVPLDGKGWITGGLFPKPVAIQGRKALGVARRKPVRKSANPLLRNR